jgi:hypothetical protein
VEPLLTVGAEVAAPQSYPDIYDRTNVFSLIPSKIAAGADFSQTVPFGVLWNVTSLIGTFTASAAAANRLIGFQVKDQGGAVVYSYKLTTALTAGLNATFCFQENITVAPTALATTNSVLMPMPVPYLTGGWSFGTITGNIDVGDQWTALGVWIQEYLPPTGE